MKQNYVFNRIFDKNEFNFIYRCHANTPIFLDDGSRKRVKIMYESSSHSPIAHSLSQSPWRIFCMYFKILPALSLLLSLVVEKKIDANNPTINHHHHQQNKKKESRKTMHKHHDKMEDDKITVISCLFVCLLFLFVPPKGERYSSVQ